MCFFAIRLTLVEKQEESQRTPTTCKKAVEEGGQLLSVAQSAVCYDAKT